MLKVTTVRNSRHYIIFRLSISECTIESCFGNHTEAPELVGYTLASRSLCNRLEEPVGEATLFTYSTIYSRVADSTWHCFQKEGMGYMPAPTLPGIWELQLPCYTAIHSGHCECSDSLLLKILKRQYLNYKCLKLQDSWLWNIFPNQWRGKIKSPPHLTGQVTLLDKLSIPFLISRKYQFPTMPASPFSKAFFLLLCLPPPRPLSPCPGSLPSVLFILRRTLRVVLCSQHLERQPSISIRSRSEWNIIGENE